MRKAAPRVPGGALRTKQGYTTHHNLFPHLVTGCLTNSTVRLNYVQCDPAVLSVPLQFCKQAKCVSQNQSCKTGGEPTGDPMSYHNCPKVSTEATCWSCIKCMLFEGHFEPRCPPIHTFFMYVYILSPSNPGSVYALLYQGSPSLFLFILVSVRASKRRLVP